MTVDGDEVAYQEKQAKDVKQEHIIFPQAGNNWTPVLVAKGLNFSMSTLFKTTASVISGMLTLMGYLQLYFGQAAVKYIISDVAGKAAVKAGSKINVKYAYDWYRTAGRVLLPGATIKTVASRYQNYRAYLIYGKKIFFDRHK